MNMDISKIKLPSNRRFGLFFTIVFFFIGIYFLTKNNSYFLMFSFIISISFLLVTILNADLLLPLNKIWMSFGLLLSNIVNPIVLGIIFFLLFMPAGLIMKFYGRDELKLKFSSSYSYWKKYNNQNSKNETFQNQF